MAQSEPLYHLWTMKYEQFHRRSKLTANVSGSYKNIIHTLAHKSQLTFCFQILGPLKPQFDYAQGSAISDTDYGNFFSRTCRTSLQQVSQIVFDGIHYKPNMVIVMDSSEDFPSFAIVKRIIVCGTDIKTVYFICQKLTCLCFSRHYQSYELQTLSEDIAVEHTSLHTKSSGLQTRLKGALYVSFKHIL